MLGSLQVVGFHRGLNGRQTANKVKWWATQAATLVPLGDTSPCIKELFAKSIQPSPCGAHHSPCEGRYFWPLLEVAVFIYGETGGLGGASWCPRMWDQGSASGPLRFLLGRAWSVAKWWNIKPCSALGGSLKWCMSASMNHAPCMARSIYNRTQSAHTDTVCVCAQTLPPDALWIFFSWLNAPPEIDQPKQFPKVVDIYRNLFFLNTAAVDGPPRKMNRDEDALRIQARPKEDIYTHQS